MCCKTFIEPRYKIDAFHVQFLSHFHFQSEQVQASDADASPPPILNTHTNIRPSPTERPVSRRDAATLTEAVNNGKRTGTRGPGHRGRRRWQVHRLKEPYGSEEDLTSDREEEWELRHRKRQDRHTPEPEYKEEGRTRERRGSRCGFFSTMILSYFSSLTYINIARRSGVIIQFLFTRLVCLYGRAPQDIKEVEAPVVHYQNSNEWVWKTE